MTKQEKVVSEALFIEVLSELKKDLQNDIQELSVSSDVRLKRVDTILLNMQDGQDILSCQVRDVQERVTRLDVRTLDMQDTLFAVAAAVDADAITTIDHERRLQQIEGNLFTD